MPKEVLSLVAKNNPEPIINSENLTNYLLGAEFLWRGNQRFTKHLDLGFYSPQLFEFYNDTHRVNVFNDQQRAKLLSHGFDDIINNTLFAEARRRLRDEIEKLVNLQGDGENSINFYYDLSDNQIRSVRSDPGDYTSTPAAIYKVLETDNIPLLEVHKHPDDSFFSPQDFHPLLTEAWKEGPSLSRAVMVLCPNIQVLALATMQTPLIPQEDAICLWKPVSDNPMEGKELEHQKDVKRIHRLIKQSGRFAVQSLERYFSEATLVEGAMKEQGASKEDTLEVVKQIADKYQVESELYYYKNAIARDKAIQHMMLLIHRTIESNFVNFARSINVVLYNSNDFRNFYQFSA